MIDIINCKAQSSIIEVIYFCLDFAGKVHVPDLSLRITNGYTAYHGQFPWQVALFIDKSAFCGGSLISSQWILTAAHCV
jgi:secreted trypsin-like serine protease